MGSIIPGFEYDIFISYRQKDNKGDKWVSRFVDALRTELEATFKEDISIFFDENPHDRLRETHHVDKSLESKLRCLIFIPVLSQTYCDPDSYAWQNELLPFIENAEKDRFGKDIKLGGGNVAGRILPVRIHDLDKEDMMLFEKTTGGVLRAMDFVFRTATGVNRPLRINEDHPQDNLNKTYYSDQVNKVAQAVKEIIQAMKALSSETGREINRQLKHAGEPERHITYEVPGYPRIGGKGKLASVISVLAILAVAAVFLYPRIFRPVDKGKMRSTGNPVSVVIMPFQNMTNDTIWNVWQDGIQDILITYLSNSSGDLKVKQPEAISTIINGRNLVSYASLTPSLASKISKELDADYFVYGSIKQAGSILRLSAQMIDSKTEEAFKSFEIEGTARESSVFQVTDSLKKMVKNYLELFVLEKEVPGVYKFSGITSSPEAYRYFIYGNKAFYSRDYTTAINWYLKSLAVDSTFEYAAVYLSVAYGIKGLYSEGKKTLMSIYDRREKMPLYIRIAVDWTYAQYFETPREQIKYLKQYLDIDDQGAFQYFLLGGSYSALWQYEKAIPAYEKSLELYEKWSCKPPWAPNYANLGYAYHKTNQFIKEKELYKKAEKDFPGDFSLLYRQAVLALSEGRTKQAENYINSYISIEQERALKEPLILTNLGNIYNDAGLLDKAEDYYRKALSLEPEDPERLNNLAWFLINRDRNIEEGITLIDKALKMAPDINYMLDTKGWGLYKKGEYKEALAFLQKSWDLYSVYDHVVYLHLEAAKKAVAGQKAN
jgi:tetratricopeptide (TPR) repeat protein